MVLQQLKVSVFASVTLRLPLRSCCAERIRFEYCCALNIELVENPACVAVATLSSAFSLFVVSASPLESDSSDLHHHPQRQLA